MMMLRPNRQGAPMSSTYAEIMITNLFTNSTTRVRALVDTGCMLSTVTDEVAQALGFDPAEFTMKRIVLADGRSVRVPTIGPIQIDYEDRSCKTEAYVMGDECLAVDGSCQRNPQRQSTFPGARIKLRIGTLQERRVCQCTSERRQCIVPDC
jgi:hypothetical protein